MIELMLMIWVIGYCFFFGLALHFYNVVGEKPTWWFYPLGLIAWPFMLGVQIGKVISAFIEIGAILTKGMEDENV